MVRILECVLEVAASRRQDSHASHFTGATGDVTPEFANCVRRAKEKLASQTGVAWVSLHNRNGSLSRDDDKNNTATCGRGRGKRWSW